MENSASFRFDPVTIGFFALFGLSGIACGLTCLFYIVKTFTLSKSVYLPIFFDAITNVVAFSVLLLISVAFAAVPNFSYGKSGCTILFLSAFVPWNFSPFFMSQISAIRLLLVTKNHHEDVAQSDKFYQLVVKTLFFMAIMYVAIYSSIGFIEDIPISIIEQVTTFFS